MSNSTQPIVESEPAKPAIKCMALWSVKSGSYPLYIALDESPSFQLTPETLTRLRTIVRRWIGSDDMEITSAELLSGHVLIEGSAAR